MIIFSAKVSAELPNFLTLIGVHVVGQLKNQNSVEKALPFNTNAEKLQFLAPK